MGESPAASKLSKGGGATPSSWQANSITSAGAAGSSSLTIVGPAWRWRGDGRLQDLGNVIHMDATEDLTGHIDALGLPGTHRFQGVASRAVDTGKTEDVERKASPFG